MAHGADTFWRESDTVPSRRPCRSAAGCALRLASSATISTVTTHGLAPDDRRRVVRVIVVTQLCLAVLTAAVVVIACLNLGENIKPGQEIDHKVKKHEKIGGDPLNILVMGSDTRVGEGNEVDDQTDIGRRSDTTILLHISADRKQVYGVSLPRDALVTRPDCEDADGKTVPGAELQLFNSAFSAGGETCTVEMMEDLTGIYIDHYVSLDFNGFKDMVDAVHGVTVCIPEDVNDEAHGIFLEAGTQELSGQDALNYVRERTELSPNADIGRMKRQQAFIASMINKVISAGTLSRPNRVYNFVAAATGSITPDPGLASLGKLVSLAREFRRTDLDDIQFITVPFEAYEPDPNRLVWAPEADKLWALIREDKPLTKKFQDEVISADEPPGTPSSSPSGSPTGGGGKKDEDKAAEAAANGLCA